MEKKKLYKMPFNCVKSFSIFIFSWVVNLHEFAINNMNFVDSISISPFLIHFISIEMWMFVGHFGLWVWNLIKLVVAVAGSHYRDKLKIDFHIHLATFQKIEKNNHFYQMHAKWTWIGASKRWKKCQVRTTWNNMPITATLHYCIIKPY